MNPDHRAGMHLDRNVLVRAADGELPEAEMLRVQEHLATCEECSRMFEQLGWLSAELERLVHAVPVDGSFTDRQQLMRRMDARQGRRARVESADQNAGLVLRRFGWSMAIAATLALGVMIASHAKRKPIAEKTPVSLQASALDIDGETFIPLPYSNPDLPVNTSRVVQMQLPVSSLADAGIVFEPVAASYRTADRTVLADVLIGADGQPLGVHILGVD